MSTRARPQISIDTSCCTSAPTGIKERTSTATSPASSCGSLPPLSPTVLRVRRDGSRNAIPGGTALGISGTAALRHHRRTRSGQSPPVSPHRRNMPPRSPSSSSAALRSPLASPRPSLLARARRSAGGSTTFRPAAVFVGADGGCMSVRIDGVVYDADPAESFRAFAERHELAGAKLISRTGDVVAPTARIASVPALAAELSCDGRTHAIVGSGPAAAFAAAAEMSPCAPGPENRPGNATDAAPTRFRIPVAARGKRSSADLDNDVAAAAAAAAGACAGGNENPQAPGYTRVTRQRSSAFELPSVIYPPSGPPPPIPPPPPPFIAEADGGDGGPDDPDVDRTHQQPPLHQEDTGLGLDNNHAAVRADPDPTAVEIAHQPPLETVGDGRAPAPEEIPGRVSCPRVPDAQVEEEIAAGGRFALLLRASLADQHAPAGRGTFAVSQRPALAMDISATLPSSLDSSSGSSSGSSSSSSSSSSSATSSSSSSSSSSSRSSGSSSGSPSSPPALACDRKQGRDLSDGPRHPRVASPFRGDGAVPSFATPKSSAISSSNKSGRGSTTTDGISSPMTIARTPSRSLREDLSRENATADLNATTPSPPSPTLSAALGRRSSLPATLPSRRARSASLTSTTTATMSRAGGSVSSRANAGATAFAGQEKGRDRSGGHRRFGKGTPARGRGATAGNAPLSFRREVILPMSWGTDEEVRFVIESRRKGAISERSATDAIMTAAIAGPLTPTRGATSVSTSAFASAAAGTSPASIPALAAEAGFNLAAPPSAGPSAFLSVFIAGAREHLPPSRKDIFKERHFTMRNNTLVITKVSKRGLAHDWFMLGSVKAHVDVRDYFRIDLREIHGFPTAALYPREHLRGAHGRDALPTIYFRHDNPDLVALWAHSIAARVRNATSLAPLDPAEVPVALGDIGESPESALHARHLRWWLRTPAGMIAHHLTSLTQDDYRAHAHEWIELHESNRRGGRLLVAALSARSQRLSALIAALGNEFPNEAAAVCTKAVAVAAELYSGSNFMTLRQVVFATEDTFHFGLGFGGQVPHDEVWNKVARRTREMFMKLLWSCLDIEILGTEIDGRRGDGAARSAAANAAAAAANAASGGGSSAAATVTLSGDLPASTARAGAAGDLSGGGIVASATATALGEGPAQWVNQLPAYIVPIECLGRSLDQIDAQFPGIRPGCHDARVYARRVQDRVETLGLGLCYPECRSGKGCGHDCAILDDLLARVPAPTLAESCRLARHRSLVFKCSSDSPCRVLSLPQ